MGACGRHRLCMTQEVIKNYFTQIGKTYYSTPNYNQDRPA